MINFPCLATAASQAVTSPQSAPQPILLLLYQNIKISLWSLTSYPHLLRYSYLFKRCHLPHSSTHSGIMLGSSSTIASSAIRAQSSSPDSLPSIVGLRCWRSRATISQLKGSRISSRLWLETRLFGNSSSNTTI